MSEQPRTTRRCQAFYLTYPQFLYHPRSWYINLHVDLSWHFFQGIQVQVSRVFFIVQGSMWTWFAPGGSLALWYDQCFSFGITRLTELGGGSIGVEWMIWKTGGETKKTEWFWEMALEIFFLKLFVSKSATLGLIWTCWTKLCGVFGLIAIPYKSSHLVSGWLGCPITFEMQSI